MSEGALSFEVPEAVQVGDTLVEEGLRLFAACSDREGDVRLGLEEER